MARSATEELDEKLYGAFWHKLQQSKFDLIYYGLHFNRCTTVTRIIKYGIIGTTSLTTGAWMLLNNIPMAGSVCAVIILVLQSISAISEQFPYESRKLELREMLAELEPLYLEMENDWRAIYGLKMSNSKIQNAIQQYEKKQAEIKRHYFKDDALPELNKIRDMADELTEEYFLYFE